MKKQFEILQLLENQQNWENLVLNRDISKK